MPPIKIESGKEKNFIGQYALSPQETNFFNSCSANTKPGSGDPADADGGGNLTMSNTVYFDDVNNETTYINKLLDDEQTYFIGKYGRTIYKKLLNIRKEYIKNDVQPDPFPDASFSMILEVINDLVNIQKLNPPVYEYLKTYLPSFDANAINRQIEYKTESFDILVRINFYVNLLYYILFIIMILLLYTGNILQLRERFVIYIFLAILPYLYPWIFLFFRKLKDYFFPIVDRGGPTQVDTNTNVLTMFSNNVTNSYKKQEQTTTI